MDSVGRTTTAMPPRTGIRLGMGNHIRTGIIVITTVITIVATIVKRRSAAQRIDRLPTPMPMGEAPAETGASSFIILSRGCTIIDYGRCNLAETAVGRYKAITGPRLHTRILTAQ